MAESNIVQLRKKGGLHKILYSKNGAPIEIREYSQDIKDPKKDGTFQGMYKGNSIPDTKHYICPTWDRRNSRWHFGGDATKLSQLINKMQLRYDVGHEREGQLITSTPETAGDRFTYHLDDVFQHKDFYGKYYMENNRLSLNLNEAKQEFLYLCYRGSKETDDKSEERVVSKYAAGQVKYELVSPAIELKKKKREVDGEMKATRLLYALDGDEQRLRAVAEVLDLPGYASTTEPDGIFLMLKDQVVENTDKANKYGGKTPQSRFVEVCSMPTEELDICRNVLKAVNLGIIRIHADHILLNGEQTRGVFNKVNLCSYFCDKGNNELLGKLIEVLDNYKLNERIN